MQFGSIGKKSNLHWQLISSSWLEGLRRLQAIICPKEERLESKDHHQGVFFFCDGTDNPRGSSYLSSNCYMQSAVPGFMGRVNIFCEPKIRFQSLLWKNWQVPTQEVAREMESLCLRCWSLQAFWLLKGNSVKDNWKVGSLLAKARLMVSAVGGNITFFYLFTVFRLPPSCNWKQSLST